MLASLGNLFFWISSLLVERRQAFFINGVVLALVAGALLLRLWGRDFGLPAYVYHPDEPEVVERAFAMLRKGNFNPHWFHYPSGYIYTLAFSFVLHFVWGALQGFFIFFPEHTTPDFYEIARVTSACFGAAIVWATYIAGKHLKRAGTGLIAAALVACSYLSVVNSHYAMPDVATGLWTTLCALFSILIVQRRHMRWYVLAGAAAGLAAGYKYNAGLCVAMVLLAHAFSARWGEWGWLDRRLVLGLGAAAGAFLLSTPYALLDVRRFLDGLGFELHYANNVYHPGYTGQSGLWYLRSVFGSADAPLGLAYVAGLIYALIRPRRPRLILFLFAVLYLAGLAQSSLHFERYLLPVIPILSLLAGIGLDDAGAWLASRLRGSRLLWAGGLTILVVALPLIAGILFDRAVRRAEARKDAGDWLVQHAPAGAKVAIEHYGLPLPHKRYHLVDVVRLWDHELAWYEQRGFDYVIASNGVWGTLLREPERYSQELTIWNALKEHHALVYASPPAGAPALITAGYTTIAEYHFPRIWIFQLSRP